MQLKSCLTQSIAENYFEYLIIFPSKVFCFDIKGIWCATENKLQLFAEGEAVL